MPLATKISYGYGLIPARYRLLDPPEMFVGREDEERRLASSGPGLMVVAGPGGMGKSALVQRALAPRAAHTWVIRCATDDTFEQLAEDVFMALCGSRYERPYADGELVDWVLRSASDGAKTIVLEDAHRLRDGAQTRWLEVLASEAREASWVVTSRQPPDVDVSWISLGPLPVEESQRLVERVARDIDPSMLRSLVHDAGGSPFWIRQLASRPRPREELLEGLSQPSLKYLAMLAIAREPLQGDAYAPERRELEERGLLVRVGDAERLHDAAADSVVHALSEDARRAAGRHAAEVLTRSNDPRDRLEAFRLSLASEPRLDWLRDEHIEWVEAGLGPRLWGIVGDAPDEALGSLKLRVALVVGSRTSLEWLTERPRPEGRDERLLWATGLTLAGFSRRAVSELRDAMQESSAVGGQLPFADALVFADALCSAGEAAESAGVLVGLKCEGANAARRDVLLAKAYFHAGQSELSSQVFARAERALESHPEVERESRAERDYLRIKLGHDVSSADTRGASQPTGIRERVIQGFRLVTEGRFGHSASVLQSLAEHGDLPAGSSLLANVARGILRVTAGRYAGLSTMSRTMVQEAEQLGNANLYYWSYILERLVNLGRAREVRELPWASSIPVPTGISDRYLKAVRVSHMARRGEHVPARMLPTPARGDGPFVACICDLVEANVCLLRGDAERAAFLAARATERTRTLGYFFFEGETLLILAYAWLCIPAPSSLATTLVDLRRVAERLRSARYRVIANLLEGSLRESPDVPALLSIAQESEASPTAARVANVLLGGPRDACDALDAALIDGLRARWSRQVVVQGGSGASWVFDAAARKVYLPGRAIPLSALASRVLACLFEGGEAGVPLDAIGRSAWSLDEFHQLRDSKRVHVAVRRIRLVLEEDPSDPKRLLTIDGGYCLSAQSAPGKLVLS